LPTNAPKAVHMLMPLLLATGGLTQSVDKAAAKFKFRTFWGRSRPARRVEFQPGGSFRTSDLTRETQTRTGSACQAEKLGDLVNQGIQLTPF
jgi:hypothetical protein